MTYVVDKQAICKRFNISMERLNEQYRDNAQGLQEMYDKSLTTQRKVNGYTSAQLKELVNKYKELSK